MPTDPNIILGYKPAQVESPLAAYGQAMQVQQAQANQQLQSQKLQEGQLNLDAQKRALSYRDTFTKSLQSNTTKNADGSLATDWGKVQEDLTNGGFGPEAVAMNGDILKAKKEGLDLLHAQNQQNLDHAQQVGRIFGALPQVDPNSPDFAIQKSAWAGAAPAAIDSLTNMGALSPQAAQQMKQQIAASGGWTPQFDQFVKQKQLEAMSTQEQVQHIQRGIDATREGHVADANIKRANAETDKVNAELADKAASEGAARASQATSGDDYKARYDALNPKIQAKLPKPEELDWSKPADAQEKILTSGMNAEQVAQYRRNKSRDASLAQSREVMNGIRQDNEAFKKMMMSGTPTPQQRQDQKTIDFNSRAAAQLWDKANQLQTALGDGNPDNVTTFVPEKGSTQPMDKTLAGNSGSKVGLVNDMKARLDSVKGQLKKLHDSSYDLIEKNGGEPAVKREDVQAAIDNIGSGIKATAKGTAKSATPSAAQPSQSAKTESAAGKTPVPNFPADLASQLTAGTPKTLKLKDGTTVTVVKDKDGNVYQQ